MILKSQQRFRRKRPNIFIEDAKKIALSATYDKRIQFIDSIETYAYETSKDLVSEKEEIKKYNKITQYKND